MSETLRVVLIISLSLLFLAALVAWGVIHRLKADRARLVQMVLDAKEKEAERKKARPPVTPSDYLKRTDDQKTALRKLPGWYVTNWFRR